MAYLLPATSTVRNQKLGAFVPAIRYRPGLLHGWRSQWKRRRTLGQPPPDATLVLQYPPTNTTPSLPPCPPPLICSAGQGSGSPADEAYQNLITSAHQSSDPLDYISPQAAIAAGLDANTVYAAWSTALRQQIASGKIKSQQDAIAQGWPAGVVTQLWAQASSGAGPAGASWLDQAPLGIANKWLLAAGGGIFLLAGLRRR